MSSSVIGKRESLTKDNLTQVGSNPASANWDTVYPIGYSYSQPPRGIYDKMVKEFNLSEKEYVFTCTNKECKCLREGIGLYFTTDDIEEAEKHSRENNSPMWIAKKGDLK